MKYYEKIEKYLGSVKFAVLIILVFAIYLIVGTFIESFNGTDYANRLVYKSIPFMLVQFLMFISIMNATLLRFPLKKRLYGFYTLHLGLLLIFAGSYVTYIAGVDGNVTLRPNEQSREISLNSDVLSLVNKNTKEKTTIELPYTASKKEMGVEIGNITFTKYLPFANKVVKWLPNISKPTMGMQQIQSTQYEIYNEMVAQELTFTTHPAGEFESTLSMGPLTVHYMPSEIGSCFNLASPKGYFAWDGVNKKCYDVTDSNSQLKAKFLEVMIQGKMFLFAPALSPTPVDSKGTIIKNSPYRIFSKRKFESSPQLFLFGEFVAFFDKDEKKWFLESLKDKEVELPWMGFAVKKIKHSLTEYPNNIPVPVKPIQDNSQVVSGQLKAIEFKYQDYTYWLTSDQALQVLISGQPVQMEIGKKSLTLPFNITLEKFKMDKDPGTNSPASYESFVSVFSGEDDNFQKAHIFMNNPMKKSGFTFYQASYFELDQGYYGSVLSVNYDPGRWIKYLGSILLVFGSIWHFGLKRKKRKTV